MWFRRSNRTEKEKGKTEAAKSRPEHEPSIDQGFRYLYMIIRFQVLLVLGIMGIIMLIGKVIATSGWVFLLMFVIFAAVMAYIYRKAKKQLRTMKESFGKAGSNYEISIMGGMLTMRIEQGSNAPKLLDAPFSVSSEPVMDAETQEGNPARKSSQLS